jgi:hypothetical protein
MESIDQLPPKPSREELEEGLQEALLEIVRLCKLLDKTALSIGQVTKYLELLRDNPRRWIEFQEAKNLEPLYLPNSDIVLDDSKRQQEVAQTSDKTVMSAPIVYSESNWVVQNAEALVAEAYLGILNRPAEQEAIIGYAAMLRETLQPHNLFNILRESSEFKLNHQPSVSLDHTEFVRNNPDFVFQFIEHPRLSSPRELGVIFIPDEFWIPFIIPIAKYLRKHYQLESVVVYAEWSPVIQAVPSFHDAIFEVLSLRELKVSSNTAFAPRVIVSHSYGWQEETRYLLKRFTDARFFVYADGFKNEVSDMLKIEKEIQGAFYFNYVPENSVLNVIDVCSIESIFQNLDKISNLYELIPNYSDASTKGYSVIYLRYWHVEPYSFSVQEIADCISRLLVRFIDLTDVLVIKRDNRIDESVYLQICEAILYQGWHVIGFDEYLFQNGVGRQYSQLPIEYFLSKGLLCNAKSHIVFDSSAGYIIATHPNIKENTDIILGADIKAFIEKITSVENQKPEDAVWQVPPVNEGLETIMKYASQYAQAILQLDNSHSYELIEQDGEYLYRIRRM